MSSLRDDEKARLQTTHVGVLNQPDAEASEHYDRDFCHTWPLFYRTRAL